MRTIVRPWSPGDPIPAGLEPLPESETLVAVAESVAFCGRCSYAMDLHPSGETFRCPPEWEARAAYGDR